MTRQSQGFVFTAEELTCEAVSLFGSLPDWPTITVEDTVKMLIRLAPVPRSTLYYAIQGVLLSLLLANDGEWPPMPPAVFARCLPEVSDRIALCAKNIALVELREGVEH